MGALLSFLGGSAFRAIWGEVAAWFTKRQDAKLELARLELQGRLEAAAHARNLEGMRLQSELGIKTIESQQAADEARANAAAYVAAMQEFTKPTGITWVDAWNGCIRPAFGTVALIIVVKAAHTAGWDLQAAKAIGLAEVVFSVIGFFFADRTLRKAGK